MLHHRPLGGAVEVDDLDVLEMDVLPDIQLGPVRQGEHAQAFPRLHAGVVQLPEFRALLLGVPAVAVVAERADALLGPGFFLVAAGATEAGIETVLVQRLLERFGLHHIGVLGRAHREGRDVQPCAIRVDVHAHVQLELFRQAVTEHGHFAELPAGVHMQQWERHRPREERLAGQVQQHGGVLAD